MQRVCGESQDNVKRHLVQWKKEVEGKAWGYHDILSDIIDKIYRTWRLR